MILQVWEYLYVLIFLVEIESIKSEEFSEHVSEEKIISHITRFLVMEIKHKKETVQFCYFCDHKRGKN